MNSILSFYRRSGKATQRVFDAFQKKEPIFKGVKVPLKQTPGRAQYYYAETLHLIPESIYYKVRMPLRFAESDPSKKYNDVVEEHVIKYLKERYSHNLFNPENGLNLDLTIGQLRQMSRASEKSFKRAESGELAQILSSEKSIGEKVELTKDRIEETLFDLEDKLHIYERETLGELFKSSIKSSSGIIDELPFIGRDRLTLAIEDVERALNKDANNEEAKKIMNRLANIARAQRDIAHIKLVLVNYWNEYNLTHTYDKVSFLEAQATYEAANQIADKFPSDSQFGKDGWNKESLDKIRNEHLPEYKKYCSEYESSRSKKENFYSPFVNEDSYDHNPEQLREDLLAYLSGAIVLKEHRFRYQHEQYDRYLTLNRHLPLSDHMTLKQFSEAYAACLRHEVEYSYNYVCPKIDANYDDIGQRNVNPINASVFFYFFSAHKLRRKWAQIILSAARYPNEKIRRAYLRFFSNA